MFQGGYTGISLCVRPSVALYPSVYKILVSVEALAGGINPLPHSAVFWRIKDI